MCGRYVTPTMAEMERFWALTDANIGSWEQRFNVAPTTQVPIVFFDKESPVVRLARWGLVPIWWKQPKPPGFTFNARIEEASSKPMWKIPLKNARCLIPAKGWYEWREVDAVDPSTGEIKKAKQPYFIHEPGGNLLHFAGLMSRRRTEDGEGYELSCSIMTRAAAGPAADVHDRMPVVLPRQAFQSWMDQKQNDTEMALALAEDNALTDVQHHRVSSMVNQVNNQGAELLTPVQNPA